MSKFFQKSPKQGSQTASYLPRPHSHAKFLIPALRMSDLFLRVSYITSRNNFWLDVR